MVPKAQKSYKSRRKLKGKRVSVKTAKKNNAYERGDVQTDIDERNLAVFAVGREWYAFDLDVILEVLHTFDIVSVPHLSELFLGVVNIREETVPVVDLRWLLKEESIETEVRTCLMTIVGSEKIGFVVDSDVEITDLNSGKFYPLPDCYTKEETEFIEGIFWAGDKFIGILNPGRVLDVLSGWRPGSEKI